MLNNLSFSTFTTAASNLWDIAKSYINPPQLDTSQNTESHSYIDLKRLFVLTTVGLFSATRNQAAISLGLVTLFAESVDAVYPTVANPITTDHRFVSGTADPNQVIFSAQSNNPNIVFTVNGVKTGLFTYAEIQGGVVKLALDSMYCEGSIQPEVNLQVRVAGTNILMDVNLIFDVTSNNCNHASRGTKMDVLNVALLLTTTGLGFWAQERNKKQDEKLVGAYACATDVHPRH